MISRFKVAHRTDNHSRWPSGLVATAAKDSLRRLSSVYCVNSLTDIGTSAYVNVRCTCCCMLITQPGNWQYSLRVPLIVDTSVYTHRIPNHIY
jgi:hypothetical protein